MPKMVTNAIIIFSFKRLFFSCFASHSTPLDHNSKKPEIQTYLTNNQLSLLQSDDNDITKIIKLLDILKTQQHNDISIMKIKACDLAII